MRKLLHDYQSDDGFRIAVSLGKVPGWRLYRKFGDNDTVPANNLNDVWPPGTPRVLPTVAGVATVSSSSGNDVPTTGSGAWTVWIEGLDANYDEVTEIVNVGAASTVEFLRINRAYVYTCGTDEVNAGDISITVGGSLQAYIEAGEGQTHQCIFTIPRNHTFIVNHYSIGVGRMGGTSDGHISALIKEFGASTSWRSISDIWLFSGQSYTNDNSIAVLPEKTEVRLTVECSSTTQCFANFAGYLISNDVL
jgi:hypothetical protein